eukprot:TRINITY_DN23123_c0_g2_i4.p1 TRINITY_DN23123_c0_g2~~TRINITY_DN23123_c0_g2_i4.p1  ORF type:complete len:476 (+),score=92.76 TRINITY_DN23123_c0_g2_i4:92-1429(+)
MGNNCCGTCEAPPGHTAGRQGDSKDGHPNDVRNVRDADHAQTTSAPWSRTSPFPTRASSQESTLPSSPGTQRGPSLERWQSPRSGKTRPGGEASKSDWIRTEEGVRTSIRLDEDNARLRVRVAMLEGLLHLRVESPTRAAAAAREAGGLCSGCFRALESAEGQTRRAVADEAINGLIASLAAALHCGAELRSAERAELSAARAQAEAAGAELRHVGRLLEAEREAARMPRAEQAARDALADQEACAAQQLHAAACEESATISVTARGHAEHASEAQASTACARGNDHASRGNISEVVHIHAISHRIAEYCLLEWAQVCSTMGKMVYVVSRHWYSCWTKVLNFCHDMQCVRPTSFCPQLAPALTMRNELGSLALQIRLSINWRLLRDRDLKCALIRRVEACQNIFHDCAIRFGDIYAELVPFHMSLHVFLHHLHNTLQRQAAREAG